MTDTNPPPPVKRPIARQVALIACAVLVAGMLLVVVVFQQPAATKNSDVPTGPVTELIVPRSLSEPGAGGDDRDAMFDDLSAETGWIQSVDETTGEPDQRYRFSRLFPNPEGLPEGWFRMEQPEAQLFLSDRRVLYFSGDSALVQAPNRSLERGTITGGVRIQLFETTAVRAFEMPDAEPLLTILTEEAEFNQELGRIECPGDVRVDTPNARLAGRGVTVQFNDLDRIVESLRIESLDHATLLSRAEDEPSEASTGNEPTPRGESGEPVDAVATDESGRDAEQSPARDRTGRRAARDRRRDAGRTEFYLLTLHDNVVVRQGAAAKRRTMSGERLTLIFSPRSEGLEGIAVVPPLLTPVAPPAPAPQPLELMLVRLALATLASASPPEPEAEETVITCDGGVTMVPLRDPTRAPRSHRDATLTLTGRPVRLSDAETAADARCAELRYRTRGGRVDLLGSGEAPLVLRSPELSATGERFWFSEARSRGAFVGAGELMIEADPAADGAGAPSSDQPGPPSPELRVGWSEAVELLFAADDGTAAETGSLTIREAAFLGEVTVRNDQIDMDASAMTVDMRADGGRRAAIEHIAADAAEIRAVGRPGAIITERLDMTLAIDDRGRSSPRTLVASGAVEASDGTQRLWAQALDVRFLDGGDAVASDTAVDASDTESMGFGAADIERVVASEDVQMLTADGIRVFADTLDIDVVAERGQLSGNDVLVVREDLVLEHGTRVDFDRAGGVARWHGPGVARVLDDALDVSGDGPIPRPRVPAEAPGRMRASWSSALAYDSSVNDGAGAIELFGDVEADIRREVEEHDTLEGQELRIEMALADQGGEPNDRSGVPLDGTASTSRKVRRFIARHQARLESRVWPPGDPQRKPNVFFVAGDDIEYDDVAGTALVTGEGTLLIRDLPEDELVVTSPDALPFSGQGTTMFHFGERLELATIGQQPARYRVVMSGGVQGSHQAIDGRTAAVTGQRFETVFERRADGDQPAPGARPLGTGARMELRRLAGRGAIYLRTTERRVECDEFDYDLISGMAQLRAGSGRLVSTSTTSGERLTAESIEWDMLTDTIRVRRTVGSVDRSQQQ